MSSTVAPSRRTSVIFDDADRSFADYFGIAPFVVSHRLADSGLFTLSRLAHAAELLMRTGRGFRFVVRDAQGRIDAKFADMHDRQQLVSAFDGLEHSNSWLKLNNVGDVDRDYAELLEAALREIKDLTRHRSAADVTLAQISVFMSSPRSVTPYHFDHEANLLCQIEGEKEVCVFDPRDKILSEREIERFYTGDLNSAPYREETQGKGRIFCLRPGLGVHHPPLAPHWVKNGPDVSVSASINMCTTEIDRRAYVYQVNHYLRIAGLSPTPPGQVRVLDKIKASAMRALSKSKPKSTAEILYSGLDRLRAPVRLVRGAAARGGTYAG